MRGRPRRTMTWLARFSPCFFVGLLAGALGALAYTSACVNDGAAFVALWCMVGIGVVGGIGPAIGPRPLAW